MNKDGLISAPISVSGDIARTLGVPSSDLGYLCSNQHNKINHWSRFKPLIHHNYDKSYHLLADYENGGTLWNGGDGKCGLEIPQTRGISTEEYASKYFNGEMTWKYNAPEPNEIQPARALDFDGYYHYAVKPITAENIATDVWLEAAGSDHRFLLGFDIVTTGTKYNLGLDDIQIPRDDASGENQYIINWYPGLLMRKKDNLKQIQAISSSSVLGSGGGSVNIEFYGNDTWLAGDWEIIPFLSKEQVQSGIIGDEIDTQYIGLDILPFDITIHAVGELIWGLTLASWYDNDPTLKQISFMGWIINNNSSIQTITVKLYLYVTDQMNKNPNQDPNATWEGEKHLGEFTVPAQTEITFASNDLIADHIFDLWKINRYLENKTYWVGVSINGNQPFEWHQIEQPINEDG